MTSHNPLTDQQLDAIEALAKNVPAAPWTVDDARAELRGSHGNLLADLWDDRLGAYFAALSPDAVRVLVDEVRHLRARLAEHERPSTEAERNALRQSFTELIAQAQQDRAFEDAFNLECQLREREEQWKAEDAAARPAVRPAVEKGA